jgi:hypothetical protein
MIPAQSTPMQISLARLTASMKTCPFAPPVAPNSSLAMIAAANDGRRRAGPIGIIEFEPEHDVEGETDRSPKPQTEQ